ncbi:MAG: flagellar biosynthetic protein FliQ [bacterium]
MLGIFYHRKLPHRHFQAVFVIGAHPLHAPAVLVAMVIGLMISLVQATTQIQEQTLTFVLKLVAVMVILSLTGPWCMENGYFTHTEQFPKYLR